MAFNGKIILAKDIKLDKEHVNVLTYSETQMLTLLRGQSNLVVEKSNYNFIRESKNKIDVDVSYDTCLQANYMAFQNPSYSNKWFFAFITDVEFLNPATTRITFEVDDFATWFSYWDPKACFVVREHVAVSDDIAGNYTLPENVELGEYKRQYKNSSDGSNMTILAYMANTKIVAAISDPRGVGAVPAGSHTYNGVYSGLSYLAFKTTQDASNFVSDIQHNVTQDIIYAMFIVPNLLLDIPESSYTDFGTTYTYKAHWVPYTDGFVNMGTGYVSKPTFLDKDYVPRNKKLLTFPYTYLLISNNAGSCKDYHYEYFYGTNCQFQLHGALSVGCSIRLYPCGYNMIDQDTPASLAPNIMEGLDAPKLPTCSWLNDPYTNWLTQNAVNLKIGTATSLGSMIVGGALLAAAPFTGGSTAMLGGGMLAGGAMGIGEQVKAQYEHSLAPLTANGGVNQGDLVFAEKESYEVYKMSIRKEYAQVIDNYFDRVGYQINRTKVPNQTGRTYWNYVQIGSAECIGYSNSESISVPSDAMANINNIYRRGVTLWHDHTNLGNYSLNNH